MRIAALYDIHGTLPALEAVLAEVAQLSPDTIVIGGDAVWGPMPRETLARLQEIDTPTHFVRGNCDRILAELMSNQDISEEVPEKPRKVAAWVVQQLDPTARDVLFSWHSTVRLAANGLGEVLFCHATPRDDTTIFTRLTPEDRLRRERAVIGEHDDMLAVIGDRIGTGGIDEDRDVMAFLFLQA